MSSPSFAQLFRRSRYAKHNLSGANSGTPDSSQDRKEVFAVAAVGFVLKHDLKFRQHFLKKVAAKELAGITAKAESFHPELQVGHESDLQLVSGRRLVVVEFKVVKGGLKAHQDPWCAGDPWSPQNPFWREGYGKKFAEKTDWDSVSYCIVQPAGSETHIPEERSDLSFLTEKTFELRSIHWSDLQRSLGEGETELEKDLFDSLGEIRVTDFQERHVKTIIVRPLDLESALKGWKVMEVLLNLCERLRCNPAKLARQENFLVGDDWIGFYHWGKGTKDWRWVGYRCEEKSSTAERRATPIVEFGFKGPGRKSKSERAWNRWNQTGSADIELRRSRHSSTESFFECSRAENSARNDFDWFKQVLGLKS